MAEYRITYYTQKLFGFDHYSIVPLFHYSMGMAQIEIVIKIIVNSHSFKISEI